MRFVLHFARNITPLGAKRPQNKKYMVKSAYNKRGEKVLKVDVVIKQGLTQPYAVIYAGELTEEIEKAASLLSAQDAVIAACLEEKRVILRPREIFMAKVENDALAIYTKSERYICKKRLYEAAELLGASFVQISKGAVVNLSHVHYVEPSLGGLMKVKLKNGLTDYISRNYLPQFKKRLGL
jgi:DNA-binding LytR/AlgR family response regulator